jgi:hypothetical protein
MGWLFMASRAFSATAGIGSKRGAVGRARCMPSPCRLDDGRCPVVVADTSGTTVHGRCWNELRRR